MYVTKCFLVVFCRNLDSIFSIEEQQNILICYLKYGLNRGAIDVLLQLGNSLYFGRRKSLTIPTNVIRSRKSKNIQYNWKKKKRKLQNVQHELTSLKLGVNECAPER